MSRKALSEAVRIPEVIFTAITYFHCRGKDQAKLQPKDLEHTTWLRRAGGWGGALRVSLLWAVLGSRASHPWHGPWAAYMYSSVFLWLSWLWQFWRVLVSYFIEYPSIWSFLIFFFIIRCGGFCFSRSVVSDSCKSMDCSPLGSSVHRISQARILEWVAISFLHGNSRTRGFPNQGFPEPDELASLESPALQADS